MRVARAFQILDKRVREPFILLGSDDHDYLKSTSDNTLWAFALSAGTRRRSSV